MVEETGSLFAMGPGRFPLVAFGGIEPQSSDLKHIDAPNVCDEGQQHNEMDEVTRARKQREWAREREKWAKHIWYAEMCENGLVGDRKCLTGMRSLEGGDRDRPESRMRRWLDRYVNIYLPSRSSKHCLT
jgi:hypothetical protein